MKKVILCFIVFFYPLTTWASPLPENVTLYRSEATVVKKGQFHAVIEDRGKLHKAIASSSSGNFLFSETGAGTRPLIIIGTGTDIIKHFLKHKNKYMVNKISTLPDIYVGIDDYKPEEQYEGLFPSELSIAEVIKGALSLLAFEGPPDTSIGIPELAKYVSGVAGGVHDTKSNIKDLAKKRSELSKNKDKSKKRNKSDLIYVKFTYLQRDGFTKIATDQIEFQTIADYLYSMFLTKGIIDDKGIALDDDKETNPATSSPDSTEQPSDSQKNDQKENNDQGDKKPPHGGNVIWESSV